MSQTNSQGGWPRGKRRNPDGKQAIRVLRRAYRDSGSLRYLAWMAKCSVRSIRRYLAGEDYPCTRIARNIHRNLCV